MDKIRNHKQPDYSETTSTYVKLFIQRAEPDLAFTKMISNEENRLGRSLPINSLLILSALQSQRRLTIAEISKVTNIGEIRAKAVVELLNVTPSQAYRLLKKMSDKGRIKLVGNGRAAHYELI